MAPVIVDTGPLVAMIDRDEDQHPWASAQLRGFQHPLLTCDAVLTESCFLLAKHPQLLRTLGSLLEDGLITSKFQSDSQSSRIFGLMETYRNVPMSFADACLVCMIENNPGSVLFSLDRGFTIYRQQRRRLIPLLSPF
jgi:predicted nucleic acid-binding protein